jgi:hypothetical protein
MFPNVINPQPIWQQLVVTRVRRMGARLTPAWIVVEPRPEDGLMLPQNLPMLAVSPGPFDSAE